MQTDTFKKWTGILVFKVSSIELGYNISRVYVLRSVKQKLISKGCITYKGKEIPLYYMGDLLKIKSNSKIKNKDLNWNLDCVGHLRGVSACNPRVRT